MRILLRQIPPPGIYPKDALRVTEVLGSVVEALRDANVGAMTHFMGVTRGRSREGKGVSFIEIESYEEHANLRICRICEEVRIRHGLTYVGIWHLSGRFYPGEPVVVVVTAGERRRGVFEGLLEAVERYKREPAIFKKEVFVDGTCRWVDE
ncbi:MAG: molybdenum cofactor biosynthesis protein MoaE [Nitrososphaerota archaeon]|nr:molybdenum cofactor biosynthesis protein MoaE [Nitrososphaerota archaeon]